MKDPIVYPTLVLASRFVCRLFCPGCACGYVLWLIVFCQIPRTNPADLSCRWTISLWTVVVARVGSPLNASAVSSIPISRAQASLSRLSVAPAQVAVTRPFPAQFVLFLVSTFLVLSPSAQPLLGVYGRSLVDVPSLLFFFALLPSVSVPFRAFFAVHALPENLKFCCRNCYRNSFLLLIILFEINGDIYSDFSKCENIIALASFTAPRPTVRAVVFVPGTNSFFFSPSSLAFRFFAGRFCRSGIGFFRRIFFLVLHFDFHLHFGAFILVVRFFC